MSGEPRDSQAGLAADSRTLGPLLGFLRLADLLSRASAAFAAAAVALIFVFMFLEIATRNLFGKSLLFTWEFSTYLLSAIIFLGAANAARLDVHIRVGLIGEILPAAVARSVWAACLCLALVVAGYLLWHMAWLTGDTISRGVVSQTPMTVPVGYSHLINTIGIGILALQVLALLARTLFDLPGQIRIDRTPDVESDIE